MYHKSKRLCVCNIARRSFLSHGRRNSLLAINEIAAIMLSVFGLRQLHYTIICKLSQQKMLFQPVLYGIKAWNNCLHNSGENQKKPNLCSTFSVIDLLLGSANALLRASCYAVFYSSLFGCATTSLYETKQYLSFSSGVPDWR